MQKHTIYWTFVGVLWGGVTFAILSTFRSLVSKGSLIQHLAPIAVMTVIAATVGGLIGPMAGAIWVKFRKH